MTVLSLKGRNSPEVLEKPPTPSHCTVTPASWGGPDCVGQIRKSGFRGGSGEAPGHRELVAGMRLPWT